ncbi:hypothetical protein CH63R_07951 [Colletotrichum higginsianum IMI 349063]|uniref:N-acetyltransferase domain-containing protein n=1 Tax=Colletotrichum higginsianum (strain IMI 349063) TaxID=759273 RepID=A0A1B7YAT8_COLHI|nr:hypothetical protein CH63R_07951 [Colletotrichum higginsianum IMI 349063]OBR09186.1 hypothetical protein CH63R_07951 [Colletotrichum higginsianum IMI 349063]
MSKSLVTLIPWDPESPDHIARMLDQRVECGWDLDQVDKWRGLQRSGFKCMYWIAFTSEDPDRDAKIAKHVSEYPKVPSRPFLYPVCPGEAADPRHGAVHPRRLRTPRETPFHPVGHISLDVDNPHAKRLNLPIPKENVYWIKSLYVSFALQSAGIGRAAMDMVESMATSEPLCARTLMLDTVSKEDQLRKESAVVAAGKLPVTPTHAWYERRGYRLIWTENNFYGFPETDGDGNPVIRRTVFLRRDLV